MSKNSSKIDRNFANIFKVRLDSTSKARVLTFVRDSIGRNSKFSIFTLNPDIILEAVKDVKYREILNSSNLSIPDGIGLAQAVKYLGLQGPNNQILRFFSCFFQGLVVGLSTFFNKKWLLSSLTIIKGRELFLDLTKLANKKSWKVFFLGGRGDVGQKTKEKLQTSLKSVKIKTSAGPILDKEGKPVNRKEMELEKETINQINEFKPQLLFVAFGAPKQERWVYKWLSRLDIGGAMVVGGTFEYFADKVAFPPLWMEKGGLEWIWRLISQPQRIKRIFKAVIIFPLKVFWFKVNS